MLSWNSCFFLTRKVSKYNDANHQSATLKKKNREREKEHSIKYTKRPQPKHADVDRDTNLSCSHFKEKKNLKENVKVKLWYNLENVTSYIFYAPKNLLLRWHKGINLPHYLVSVSSPTLKAIKEAARSTYLWVVSPLEPFFQVCPPTPTAGLWSQHHCGVSNWALQLRLL